MNYFTADLHFFHEKAINFPGRKGFTVDSWIELMSGVINKTVTKSDRLYILGDFALGTNKMFAKARMLLKPKDIFLIYGNHDGSETNCRNTFGEKFKITCATKVCGNITWLSHYPHLVWPASHYGSYHLFGHLHDMRTDCWEGVLPQMRSLDVCPESYKRYFGEFGIFSEEQIDGILKVRSNHDDVSWYKKERGEL